VALENVHEIIYNNEFRQKKPKMQELVKNVEKLVDKCWSRDRFSNDGKGQDNITAVLVEFNK